MQLSTCSRNTHRSRYGRLPAKTCLGCFRKHGSTSLLRLDVTDGGLNAGAHHTTLNLMFQAKCHKYEFKASLDERSAWLTKKELSHNYNE